jgi:hypothetical protein
MDKDDLRACLADLEVGMTLTVPHDWAEREFPADDRGEHEAAAAAIAAECHFSWTSRIEGFSFEKRSTLGAPLVEPDRRAAAVSGR